MQRSVRTPCRSGPSIQLPEKSRWAPWISCLLAVIIGSIAESACAGSESSIESATPAIPSEPTPLRSSDPGAVWAADRSFRMVTCGSHPDVVSLRSVGQLRPDSSWNFVIAHGLGGMICGDRFCQLAIEIKRLNPDANVLLIDWTSTAAQTSYGFPRIWHVASCLDAIATEATLGLSSLKIDPDQTTLIGESFGVYIQGRVAKSLGGVRHILAFNPASEAGGYAPVNLCKCSKRAWSFHTFCVYDTTLQIAHSDFVLETPDEASPLAQHTYGIQWLTKLLRAGDISWLALNKSVQPSTAESFAAIALETGDIDPTTVARVRIPAESAGPVDNTRDSRIVTLRINRSGR